MPPRSFVALALAATATLAAAPAVAQLYKWVDEKGATHYSDRKPDDEKTAAKVKSVEGASVSVYSPDKTLLKAVERAREKASREPPPEPERVARPYVAPAAPQPPLDDPCATYGDCGPYYSYVPAYAARRHGQAVNPAVFPAGATAGTVNSPGIIPGNSGTTPTGTAGHPEPPRQSSASRPRPRQMEPEQRFSAR